MTPHIPALPRWSKLALVAGLGAAAPGLSGCGSLGADDSLSAAQVRFVQVSPGSPDLDFYVNGTGAAYGVGYESFTSYLPVSPGASSLSVTRAGLGQTLAASQTALSGGRQYTVLLHRGLGSLQEHVFPDQDTPAPAGQMALRVLNAVEGTGAVTIHLAAIHGSTSANETFTVAPAGASPYVSAPAPGSYTVTATAGDSPVSLPLARVTLKAGSGAVRTVVFAGTAQPGAHANVVGFSLVDADPI